MNKINWKAVTEFSGMLAIVASLIFVGLELRQSQEIAIASQYQARSEAAMDQYLSRMQSQGQLEIVASSLFPDDRRESLAGIKLEAGDEDPIIMAHNYLLYRTNITAFDNYHFQYEQGFLTEDAWLAFRQRLKILLGTEIWAEFYRQQPDQFRASFSELCDQLLAENAASSN